MSGTGPFPVVRVADPAIDHETTDLSAFFADRDYSRLKWIEGERPTIYHCRHLDLAERREVRNKSTDPDRYEAAFVRGLVRVEGMHGDRESWTRDERRTVPDAVLRDLFDEEVVQEIGAVIWLRSFLARGTTPFYPLLDISRFALTAESRRRAGLMKTSEQSDDGNQLAAGPPPETPGC